MKSDSPEVKKLKEKFGPGELTKEQREELRLAEIAAGRGERKSGISGLMTALSSPPPAAPSQPATIPAEGVDLSAPKIAPQRVPKIEAPAEPDKPPVSALTPARPKK
jgi:hypothetical protein